MPSAHHLQLVEPASGFINAFPIGNGWLGAMVHGRPQTERIDVNVDTLWSGGPLDKPSSPAEEGTLALLRDAISRGDFGSAENLARMLQGPGFSDSYQPIGWLEWEHGAAPRGEYRRVLELDSATTTTSYDTPDGPVTVTSFASAPAGAIVVEATGEGTVNGRLIFRTDHPSVRVDTYREGERGWLVVGGRVPEHVTPNYVEDDNPVRYATDTPDEHGLVDRGMGFALVALTERPDPHTIRLIISAKSGFRGHKARPSADFSALAASAREHVLAAALRPTAVLREEHCIDYRQYYGRTSLELSADNPVKIERARRSSLLFNFGRYLLISSSRPRTQPANLQGIWNIDVRPGWSCNYTTNINLQMNYWPAEVTGLHEMAEPLVSLLLDLAEGGQAIAEQYYGAGGSAIHHNTDLWRFGTPVYGEPAYANWPSALIWLASHLWERHQFDQNDECARADAESVYGHVVRFALDMLVEDSDAKLVFSPSTSPEHYFMLPNGATAAVSAGSTIDQELVHEALSRYIKLAWQVGGDEPEATRLVDRARTALSKLRLPSIGSGGDLLEWTDERRPGEPGHRHLSHLYGLYPGDRITEQATPADFEAARTALRQRLEAGSGYTGWSQSWVLCLAARLREGALAESALDTLLDELCSDALLDLHPHPEWPGGYIFQIDGNFGAVAGIAELLVQSHEGTIAILKALPPSWTSGRATGFRARRGHIVDLEWADARLDRCRVLSGSKGNLTLDLPFVQSELMICDDAGREVPFSSEGDTLPGRRSIKWHADSNRAYIIDVRGIP